MKRTLWLLGVLALAIALGALSVPAQQSGGIVLAPKGQLSLSGQIYAITVPSSGPFGLIRSHYGMQIIPVAGSTRCPVGNEPGDIEIMGHQTIRQQAKAVIHETVHTALTCDTRDLQPDEKIAEAISDLLESPVGRFVEEGLQK